MENKNAYDRVIAAVQAKTGKERGAASWLADHIGVSRQLVDTFRRRGGFPEKYVSNICRVTGLPRDQVSTDLTPEIVRLSRKWRCSVKEAEDRILRAGLAQFK